MMSGELDEIPEWLNRKIQQKLAERGMEMTPDQVISTRKVAFAKIRTALREQNYDPPESDNDLLDWMKGLGL